MSLNTPSETPSSPSKLTAQAKQFQQVFTCSNTSNGQATLIAEESVEFYEAHDQWVAEPMLKHHKAECLKELADLVYVCFQYAAFHRWDLDEALERVHQSNLSKLGDNGEVLRRDDGKILKGSNYKPPTLIDLV